MRPAPALAMATSAVVGIHDTARDWGVAFEVVLLTSGIALTLLFAIVARSIRRLRFSWCGIFTILIGAGDFCTDIVFARTAWRRVTLLLAAQQTQVMAARVAEARLIAILATTFVAGPILISTVPLAVVIITARGLLDSETFSRYPSFFGCLLVLALTNLELLRLLPWNEKRYDGLPTPRVLAVTFLTSVIEDIPQVVLQIYAIAFVQPTDGEPNYAITVSFISLFFSLASIWWRGFRKLIIALFPSAAEGASTVSVSRPAFRGPRTPKRVRSQHPFFVSPPSFTLPARAAMTATSSLFSAGDEPPRGASVPPASPSRRAAAPNDEEPIAAAQPEPSSPVRSAPHTPSHAAAVVHEDLLGEQQEELPEAEADNLFDSQFDGAMVRV